MNAYNSWKSTFVTSNGAGGFLRVQSPQHASGTVSEGIGYGMLAAVYMNDRTTFDGLWSYAKAHFDAKGLMNWQITSAGTTSTSLRRQLAPPPTVTRTWPGPCLMASDQWSSATYFNDGTAVIEAIYANCLAADGTLKPGDNWGGTMIYPDYFSPAYYRVFARAVNNSNWSGDHHRPRLHDPGQRLGNLRPRARQHATRRRSPPSGTYAYDACRTPWRIAMDYCFNGEARAKTYLDKIGPFFNGMGAANIGDKYNTTGGAPVSNNHNMAFIGPAGVAGMAG